MQQNEITAKQAKEAFSQIDSYFANFPVQIPFKNWYPALQTLARGLERFEFLEKNQEAAMEQAKPFQPENQEDLKELPFAKIVPQRAKQGEDTLSR